MLNIWKLVKRVLIFTWNNGYQPEAYTSDVQSTDYFKFSPFNQYPSITEEQHHLCYQSKISVQWDKKHEREASISAKNIVLLQYYDTLWFLPAEI